MKKSNVLLVFDERFEDYSFLILLYIQKEAKHQNVRQLKEIDKKIIFSIKRLLNVAFSIK
jgi:hypothetical protein